MKAFRAALVGAVVALAVVGGFLALDKTTLHLYRETNAPTAIPTVAAQTRWYYVSEQYARTVTTRYGTDFPPCSELLGNHGAVPAFPGAPPIVTTGSNRVPGEFSSSVSIAIECSK